MITRVLVAVMLLAGCTATTAGYPPGVLAPDKLPFRAWLDVERRAYAAGETVAMAVVVENTATKPVALVFRTRERATFEVSFVGRGKPVHVATVKFESDPPQWIQRVMPRRSWRMGVAWDGWGEDRSAPPLGKYQIRAIVHSDPPFAVEPVEIGLVD